MDSLQFRAIRPGILAITLGFVALELSGCATSARKYPPTIEPAASSKPIEISKAARLRVARSFRDAGDYAAALRLYQEALAENPNDVEALVGIGELYAKLKAFDPARQSLDQALKLAPQNAEALAGMGQILVAQGQPAAALDFLTKAAAADAKNPHVFNSLGLTYDLLERHDEAQVSYGRGLDNAPGDGVLLNNLALSFVLSKNYATAIRILSGLVTSGQSPATSRQNLALAYGLSGDQASAERLLALDLTPDQIKDRLFYFRRLQAAGPEAQTKALFLGIEPMPVISQPAPTTPASPPASEAPRTPDSKSGIAPEISPKPVTKSAPPQADQENAAPMAPAPAQAIKPATQAPRAAKRYSVQLGSYKSENFARASWQKISKAHNDLLQPFSAAVMQADLGAQGTNYRLYIKEITGLDAAKALCDKLRQEKADCLVRQFPAAEAPAPAK